LSYCLMFIIFFLHSNDIWLNFQEKYKQCWEEAQQYLMGEDSSSKKSLVASIDDNEIYFNVVGGGNKKENVYGLGTLSKRFTSSKTVDSTTN